MYRKPAANIYSTEKSSKHFYGNQDDKKDIYFFFFTFVQHSAWDLKERQEIKLNRNIKEKKIKPNLPLVKLILYINNSRDFMKKSLTANNHIQKNSRDKRLALKNLIAYKYTNNKHAIKKSRKLLQF